MMKHNKIKFLVLGCLLAAPSISLAQLDDSEIISLEQEYEKQVTPPAQQAPATPRAADPSATADASVQRSAPVTLQEEKDDNSLKEFSGLTNLAPFSEVSVIQRRFLPKTDRFQLFGGVSLVTNQPWFTQAGVNLRIGYNFWESLGLEFTYSLLQNSERDVTREARERHNIQADEIAFAKNFMGAVIQWSPIYGKMAWFNKRIIPFDLYFNVGGGTVKVANKTGDESKPGIMAGTGQVFAITKGMGFRWDFTYLTYEVNTALETTRRNDLLLSAGMSFFWPEASYR